MTYRRQLDDLVALDSLRLLIDLVGNIFWSGSTVASVVLDSKVGVGSSRVVTCSQQNTPSRFIFPDHVGGCGCRQDTVLSNDEFGNAISRANFQDGLDSLGREESAISTDDKSGVLDCD